MADGITDSTRRILVRLRWTRCAIQTSVWAGGPCEAKGWNISWGLGVPAPQPDLTVHCLLFMFKKVMDWREPWSKNRSVHMSNARSQKSREVTTPFLIIPELFYNAWTSNPRAFQQCMNDWNQSTHFRVMWAQSESWSVGWLVGYTHTLAILQTLLFITVLWLYRRRVIRVAPCKHFSLSPTDFELGAKICSNGHQSITIKRVRRLDIWC